MTRAAEIQGDVPRHERGAALAILGLALACALAAAGIEPGPASPGADRGGHDAHPEEEVIDEYRDRLLEDWL